MGNQWANRRIKIMKQELTEEQLHLFNTVQDLRKEFDFELTKKQISEILTDRGYADSAISLYHRLARIKNI